MGYAGEKGGIPRVVKDCILFLQESGICVLRFPGFIASKTSLIGLEQDGLFRRSPNSLLLRQVQEAYDRGEFECCASLSSDVIYPGNVVSMETIGDPHLAAVLLKKYLRDLPEPIFPEKLYQTIRRCPTPSGDTADMSSVTYIRNTLLPELAPCVYILLSHYLRE